MTDERGTNVAVPGGAVLVGVDGSAHALAAARWAATEAASRQAPLVLAHVAPYLSADAGPPEIRHARGVLARAEGEAERYSGGVPLHTGVDTGEPAESLTRLSDGAALMVLGLTGTGGIDEVLLGSTTLALSGTCRCPLVGVRHWPMSTGTDRFVLLGLSSVHADLDAIEVAFDLAQRRGRHLLVLHSLHGSPGRCDEHTLRREQNLLAWELRGWRHRYPGVEVSYEVATGVPSTELLRRTDQAEAVVVGSRKRGTAARALLGSTSRTVLRYSWAPTIVIGPNATPLRQPDPTRPGHALTNLW